MKKYYSFLLLLVFCAGVTFGQKSDKRSQRFTTDALNGKTTEYSQPAAGTGNFTAGKQPLTPGINWLATDAASIDNYSKVGHQNHWTAAAWGLNDQRLSAYSTTNVPEWEEIYNITNWDEMIDMTDDGTWLVSGVNSNVVVYQTISSVPYWVKTLPYAVKGVQIQNEGLKVYVAAVNPTTQDSSIIYCFNIGESNPLWKHAFAGNFTALVASRGGSRVLVGEYGSGINKLIVLNGDNGSVVSELPYANQNPPAVSYDGKYIVSGDYSNHLWLYEYQESSGTYTERWNYSVNGTNSWIAGMGISADGSTLACGTLIFTAAGGYDGELYVFSNNSPVPLWIYSGMGDMVQCVDLSADGSIVAAGGWGPYGNSGPDIFLFRKQSNVPYLTVNSPGSIFCLDLTPDGKMCVTGGKGVHAREFGMGGTLYNINSDPGGGTLGGTVLKTGDSKKEGARVEVIGLTSYYTVSDSNSAYTLKYIPAGTYTVRYSAVGYVTQDFPNIVITDGQTTTQDVVLQPTGTPPEALSATQGAGLSVDLSWDASSTLNITGYNIYRKKFAFEMYPDTPIGTAGAAQLSYSDATALPLTHYYYTVTAVLQGGLETPYSNEAQGWTATGFITDEISAYVGATPAIDGVISPGEWSDAFRVELSNFLGNKDNILRPVGSVTGWFKVNAALTELYVAVENTNDTVLEDHDEVALYVDDNNDGLFPPVGDSTEGNYWAAHYASGDVIKYRPIYNTGGVGYTFYLPNPQIVVSAASGHPVYEFVIPLGSDAAWKLDFNASNQSGLFAFVLDDPSNYDGWWPCLNQNIFTAEGYGVISFGAVDQVPPAPLNLQLAQPVLPDFILNWDQPAINDFDHFFLYWSSDGGATFTKLDSTVGVQYFLSVTSNGLYKFYVTTVDQAGQESGPSNIVQALVNIGLTEPQGSDLAMFRLGPNPFSRELNIDLRIVRSTYLDLQIFDIQGKMAGTIYNALINAGMHHFTWNGEDASGNRVNRGIYFIRYRTGGGKTGSFKAVLK